MQPGSICNLDQVGPLQIKSILGMLITMDPDVQIQEPRSDPIIKSQFNIV